METCIVSELMVLLGREGDAHLDLNLENTEMQLSIVLVTEKLSCVNVI